MRKIGLWMILLLLSVTVVQGQDAAQSEVRSILSVTPLAETVGVYEKFELVIALDATFNHPYDPQDIRVQAQFTSPSGRSIIVPAFYYQEFTYQSTRPQPTPDFSWRVRFTPQESGAYQYSVTAATAAGSVTGGEGTFTAEPSDLPGFVRVDARNPRYFAFDDGSPYFPVGLNVAWSNGDTIADYERWLDKLQASGGNFIRVWMAPWNMSIEWIDTGLGDYTKRQFRAYELDKVFEMAEQRGIYIMLTLLNHGQFNTATNPEWDDNPYNAANGGPCDVPECFATNEQAVHFWEQRLRYIVARWGYSTHLMAWEWWNEVNWTPLAGAPILGPWIERNSSLMHELDPYQHLLTHSGSPSAVQAVWSPLDFAQDHFYDRDDFPRTFQNAVEEWAAAYPDKPFLPGEFGRASEALSYDTEGLELHLGIWSAPMNGAAGTAMTWWWDTYIEPNNLWTRLFKGISAFFAGEDPGAHRWHKPDAEFAERTRARIYGLQDAGTALLWVLNRDYSPQYLEKSYLDNLRKKVENPLTVDFPVISGAVLVVNGLPAGEYNIEVWNTFSGDIIAQQTATASQGSIQISLPDFDRDLALKVKPQ